MPGDIGLSAIHAITYFTPVITHGNADNHKPEFEALKKNLTLFTYELDNWDSLTNVLNCISNTNLYTDKFFIECERTISMRYNADVQEKLICEAILR